MKSFHENPSVGLMLTFIGGMLDSYTYLRYQAFASAQTGNLVLAIIQGFDGQWASVGKKLLSTLCFFLGIFLAKYLIDLANQKKWFFWRLGVLYYEAVIFLLLTTQFFQPLHTIVIMLIAFTAAIQWISFDKINGLTYTNLFTTGNLKGMATNFYDYLKNHDPLAKKGFFHFSSVVTAFISGVVVAVFCYHLIGYQTTFIIALCFLALALSQTFFIWKFTRGANLFHKKTGNG
ncbi:MULTISPECIES: YoaK family protein [Enterococcus]|uniref:DUF1275 domain-containing protein n=1 Tax=Enterococcus alishanensis TaxID=1303817 RepID=A0ABS6T8P4_9ENTE|nr:YoaK family protein [Enterococcus alishanensis]MBV7389268.1 DUF1275 domain-containing protein [Enterococcus alishanensis]